MFEHALMQKQVTRALAALPTYLGQLAQDHWYIEAQHIGADYEAWMVLADGGEALAFAEMDDGYAFAWRLGNGRLMTGQVYWPENMYGEDACFVGEVWPVGTPVDTAHAWVRHMAGLDNYRKVVITTLEDGDFDYDLVDVRNPVSVEGSRKGIKQSGGWLSRWLGR